MSQWSFDCRLSGGVHRNPPLAQKPARASVLRPAFVNAVVASLVLAFATNQCAIAQTSQQKSTQQKRLATQATPYRYSMRYIGSFVGLELGNAHIIANLAGNNFTMAGAVKNSGGVGGLLQPNNILVSSAGVHDPKAIVWKTYHLDHTYSEKNKHRNVDMRNTNGRVEVFAEPGFGPPVSMPVTSAQKREARDPLSTVFAISRHVALTKSCAGTWPIYDGHVRYDLVATQLEPAPIGGVMPGMAIRCLMRYERIAGFKPGKPGEAQKPYPEPIFWFVIDKRPDGSTPFAPIVRMEMPVLLLGSVNVDLTELDIK